MERKVEQYRMYEDYLETVVALSPDFKTVDDVVARFESLSDARSHLIERQETDLTALETSHADTVPPHSKLPL